MDYEKPNYISSGKILELKQCSAVEESCGMRPLEVTAVLPTFNRGNQKYMSILSDILQKIGHQVDKGVVDELLIIDGSTKNGEIDKEFLQDMLNIFFEHCQTFQRELEFIESLPAARLRAGSGRYEFCCKVIHQRDEIISEILENQGIFDRVQREEIKNGKGSALWLSVPTSRGDIIAFLDSDIKSFEEYYVTDLVYPILKDVEEFQGYGSSTLFSKASYLRQHDHGDRYRLGGRLARLAIKPIFEILDEKLGKDEMRSIKYPLSGEVAFHREALNHIRFSNGYDIEVSMLFQFMNNYGKEKMAQPNFGFYQHLPGPETHVKHMLGGISHAIFNWLEEYEDKDKEEIEKLLQEILDDYKERAFEKLEHYREIGKKYSSRVTYCKEDIEEDKERIENYDKIMKDEMLENKELNLLPKWASIKSELNEKRGYSYNALKRAMGKRVNMFTAEMISEI